MNRSDEILLELVAIVGRSPDLRPRLAPEGMVLETRLREELGFDSIALMAIAYELQESHPALDETAIATWHCVGDCVAAVMAADGASRPS